MSEQPQSTQPKNIRGIVKQVHSGDTIVIRGVPKGGPPPEMTVCLSFITAPKLTKRVQQAAEITLDEPFAWEAREFLRKKLIGQSVFCFIEKPATVSTNREIGTVYHGPDATTGENINELLVREGLVTVRGDNMRQPTPEHQRLLDLQEQAKKDHKGKWDDSINVDDYKRKITWSIDNNNMMSFVEKMDGKPLKAVIEHVRDGSTVRAFLILPEFVYITLMMSGIRSPQFKLDASGKPEANSTVEFADEAKFFTESRLLQQEVEIILESANGSNFVGSILHPKGSIAEELLKAGLAKCVDWSIAKMKKADVEKLRHAEKIAKEKKLKQWKDWKPPPPISDKEFVGTVTEVINGDALMVKLPNGNPKKIFLASVRPPRPVEGQDSRPPGKISRQLYDVPWMFEAREFLRKKLIGKKVNVSVDYIQPPRENMAEKCCCTVTISNVNVAETLVSKGLATVVRYRQNDDQRASAYDSLLAAEVKAIKSLKGLHAKKDIPTHRVNDYSGESAKAKGLLPHLQRLPRVEALVEYVASGSRMRVFIPKESSLVVFLLSGIDIRVQREDGQNNEDLAVQFSRERVMQREVEIKVENSDKAGSFIGWLWCEGVNLSVALVEHGLAKVHASGENSEYSKLFMNAKNTAKSNGLWKFSEVEEMNNVIEEDKTPDRKIDYKEVMVVVTSGISFYCQFTSEEGKLNALQDKLTREMGSNAPLPGAYTPKKGDTCAAKFSDDNSWYRAKVEKVSAGKVSVHYIDYGNKADVLPTECAALPPSFDGKDDRPYARHYTLICVQATSDIDYQQEQENQFYKEVTAKKFHLNEELNQLGVSYATLVDPENKEDIGKKLIADGLLLVERRRERKFQSLVKEYLEAEEEAKKNRFNVWEYGDVREDDDKEFGMGR